MSWVTVMCPDGPYELNAEGVARMIRSYAFARAASDNSEVKAERHVFGPDIILLKTDWVQVPNRGTRSSHKPAETSSAACRLERKDVGHGLPRRSSRGSRRIRVFRF
jgi:hypothetical protein